MQRPRELGPSMWSGSSFVWAASSGRDNFALTLVVLAQIPDAALYKFVLGALHQWARNEAFEHRSRGRYHRSTANHTPEHRRTPRPVAEWTGEGVPALR